MGLQDHLSKITDSLNDIEAKPVRQRVGARPATSSLSHFSDELRESTAEIAALKKSLGQSIRIALDLCDDGPFHASPLDLERVQNLKANIKENGQSAPALLRSSGIGRYEIIAGRHRKAALLELGSTEWDAVIKDVDDDAAERLTFYDNLLAPNLTDYAKYQGFALRKKSKGFTDEQLALESGVSRTAVTRLFSFSKFPAEAHRIIETNPSAIGGTLAAALAPLMERHSSRAIEAVQLVVEKKLSAAKAVPWILDVKKAEKPAQTLIRQGKAVYAKIGQRNGLLTIKFTNPEESARVAKGVADYLRRLASGENT